MPETTPTPGRFIVREDREGERLAHVPLPDGSYFTLDGEDADRLLAAGVKLGGAYVARFQSQAEHVAVPSLRPQSIPFLLVARLVTGALASERVKYRDGNRRNLRRSNLKVDKRTKTATVLAQSASA
jgi:hypothetical protein